MQSGWQSSGSNGLQGRLMMMLLGRGFGSCTLVPAAKCFHPSVLSRVSASVLFSVLSSVLCVVFTLVFFLVVILVFLPVLHQCSL